MKKKKYTPFVGMSPNFSKDDIPWKLVDIDPFRYLNLNTDFDNTEFNNNARATFGEDGKHVNDLMNQILSDNWDPSKSIGPFVVYNPITEKFTLLGGFHRFHAHSKANKSHIPVTVVEILPGHVYEEALVSLQLWENKKLPQLPSSDADIVHATLKALATSNDKSDGQIRKYVCKIAGIHHKTNQCKKLIREIRNKLGMPVPENREVPASKKRSEWVATHKAKYPDNTDAIVISMQNCQYNGGMELPENIRQNYTTKVADNDYEQRYFNPYSPLYQKLNSPTILKALQKGKTVMVEQFFVVKPGDGHSIEDITHYKVHYMMQVWNQWGETMYGKRTSPGKIIYKIKPIPQTAAEKTEYEMTGGFRRGDTFYDLR